MIWTCFAAAGTCKIVRIDGIMDSERYQAVLIESVLPSVRKLGLGQGWICYQDNNPKHQRKSKKRMGSKKEISHLGMASAKS